MEILDRVCSSIKLLWLYTTSHPIEVIGLILAYFSLIVPIRQYLNQKELEEKDKRFNNYHRLIKELVGEDDKTPVFIDRQIAIIFELRNYSEYYEVSKRILLGLRSKWTQETVMIRVVQEIDFTVRFIDKLE